MEFKYDTERFPISSRVFIVRATNEKEITNRYSEETTEDVITKYSGCRIIKYPHSSIKKRPSDTLFVRAIRTEKQKLFAKIAKRPFAKNIVQQCGCNVSPIQVYDNLL